LRLRLLLLKFYCYCTAVTAPVTDPETVSVPITDFTDYTADTDSDDVAVPAKATAPVTIKSPATVTDPETVPVPVKDAVAVTVTEAITYPVK